MRRNAEGAGGASNAALFGEVLRHYREAALLTQEALARQIPCDRSQVAKIEAGTRVPSDQFAKRCDEVLETGGVLARIWAKVDWYPQVVYPDWFERRVQMDNEATSILQYLNNVVPGLMQTEEYMYELFKGAIGDTVSVEERVRARLSRQQRILSRTARSMSRCWTRAVCAAWWAAPASCGTSSPTCWPSVDVPTSASRSSRSTHPGSPGPPRP